MKLEGKKQSNGTFGANEMHEVDWQYYVAHPTPSPDRFKFQPISGMVLLVATRRSRQGRKIKTRHTSRTARGAWCTRG
jgi:hypothetical protein